MGQVLVFTSGKGGVGKTTLAANLAFCLAANNRKVALVDLDVGLRNLDIIMGVEHKIVYHIGDVLQGVCRLKQALIKDTRNNNLMFLPGILSWDYSLSFQALSELIGQLKNDFDFIIIDGPAGMDTGFQYAMHLADEVFLVVNPEICSIRDASQVKEHIDKEYDLPIRLIVNRTRKAFFSGKHFLTTKDIEDMLILNAFGELPNDEQIVCYINKGDFFAKKNLPISRALERICIKIIQENREYELC